VAERQPGSFSGRQTGGKRLVVTIAAVAAVLIITVFLVIMLLSGRPDEEIDGPSVQSGAQFLVTASVILAGNAR
jgi:hypothetical protein